MEKYRGTDVVFWIGGENVFEISHSPEEVRESLHEETGIKMRPCSRRGREWHSSDGSKLSKGTEAENNNLKICLNMKGQYVLKRQFKSVHR